MCVLSVTPGFFPLLKTGGLADVTGALPLALTPGVEVRTLLPAYPAVLAALPDAKPVAVLGVCCSAPAPGCSRRGRRKAPTCCCSTRHISTTAPAPLSRPDGKDWPDNYRRFPPGAGCL